MSAKHARLKPRRNASLAAIATALGLLAPLPAVLLDGPASAAGSRAVCVEYDTYSKVVGYESPCVGSLTIDDTHYCKNVTVIDDNAFNGESDLTRLNVGNSVQIIGSGAFLGSSSLGGILTFPESVTSTGITP
jgi:hypothetical protein